MKPFKDIYKEKKTKKLDELVEILASDKIIIRSGIADRKASVISRERSRVRYVDVKKHKLLRRYRKKMIRA